MAAPAGLISTGVFNYLLYDQNGVAMMSAPTPDAFIVDEMITDTFDDPAPSPGVFPSPGTLYRKGSLIQIDLFATSAIAQGDPSQIVLHGAQRIPARKTVRRTPLNLRSPYITPPGCRDVPFI